MTDTASPEAYRLVMAARSALYLVRNDATDIGKVVAAELRLALTPYKDVLRPTDPHQERLL